MFTCSYAGSTEAKSISLVLYLAGFTVEALTSTPIPRIHRLVPVVAVHVR